MRSSVCMARQPRPQDAMSPTFLQGRLDDDFDARRLLEFPLRSTDRLHRDEFHNHFLYYIPQSHHVVHDLIGMRRPHFPCHGVGEFHLGKG